MKWGTGMIRLLVTIIIIAIWTLIVFTVPAIIMQLVTAILGGCVLGLGLYDIVETIVENLTKDKNVN
jgi:predicted histidine transporter YuiF (NhaC family)